MAITCQAIDGVCSQCGVAIAVGRVRQCRLDGKYAAAREPSITRQAWTYAKSLTKWELAGSPTRGTEEIEAIFAICQACPEFIDKGRTRCRLCGCSINNSPDGLKSKIAMATESCPAKPPKWEASTPAPTPQSETPPPALGK